MGTLAIRALRGQAPAQTPAQAPDLQAPCVPAAPGVQAPCIPDAPPSQSPFPSLPHPSLPPEGAVLERARVRLAAVAEAGRLVAGGLTQAEADRIAAGAAGVSPASVASWRARVRGLGPEARLAALMDAPRRGRPKGGGGACGGDGGGAGGGTSEETLDDLLAALAFEHGAHLTASHVARVARVRLHVDLSLRSLQRRLAAFRKEHARDLSAVSDPDGHRSRRAPAFGRRSENAQGVIPQPNALWELDSTPADVMCTDGRQTIVGAIDVGTRRGRLLVVPVSRATAICALLRRCLIDWGVPEVVRTDEGRDYTSAHLVRALADLGITHDICPPYTPEAKPFIERFFGTTARDLFAYLPGFVGHNVADRKKIEAKRSMAARRGKDGRETFSVALSAAELQARCDAWTDGIYHTRPHAGLGGETPAARARAWTDPLARIADVRALDPLLAEPVRGGGTRVVQKEGLRIAAHWHIAPELGPLVGERVGVRRDPAEPGRVLVFTEDGRFLCLAGEATGQARAAVAAQARARAKKADSAARARARKLRRGQTPERAMDDVLEAARSATARVVDLPRSADPHETPALGAAGAAARAARAMTETGQPGAARVNSDPFRAALRQLYLEEDQT